MEMWNFRGNLKERQTFNWLGGGDILGKNAALAKNLE